MKDSIFHRVPKQLDEFFFINYQVDAIVLAVFVFAKPQCLPCAPVDREEISLDSTFVVVVELASTDRSTFNRVHFGHLVPQDTY